MIYKTGDFTVCGECLSWLANGDASNLDYHYRPDTAAARLEAIQYGERVLVEQYGQVHIGDTENESKVAGWSIQTCDCCAITDNGERYPVETYTAARGRVSRDIFDRLPSVAYAADQFIISATIAETEWQKRGLSYTASGYGAKIPTRYMVQCADGRARRVYCAIYSNVGSLYILYKGERLNLDQGAESKLEQARDAAEKES